MQGRNMVSVVIDQLGNRNPTFFPTTMRSPCCVGINFPSLRSYLWKDDPCYWKGVTALPCKQMGHQNRNATHQNLEHSHRHDISA